MSTSDIQEPTRPHVADLATTTIKLDRLALIGVVGTKESRAALLRDSKGAVQRVIVGDSVADQIVSAIGEDQVILTRGNQSRTLSLPKT